MKEKELRRSMAVFPIGTVMKLTDLTDADVRRILQDELRNQGRFSAPSQYIGNWRI